MYILNEHAGESEFVDSAAQKFMQDTADVEFGINIVLGTTASTLFATKAAYGGSGFSKSQLKLIYDKATKTWTSPAGLICGYDKKYGNRVKHVLEHSKVKSKDNHSVFSVPIDQVLGLLDEAWARKSPAFNDKGLDVRVVDMGKVIGTHGERSVCMVTRPGTAEIISAYPVK